MVVSHISSRLGRHIFALANPCWILPPTSPTMEAASTNTCSITFLGTKVRLTSLSLVLLLPLLKTDTTFPVTGDLSVVTISPRWDGAASPIPFHRLACVQFASGVQCNPLPRAPLTPNRHLARADLANKNWGKETLHTSAFSWVLHHSCLPHPAADPHLLLSSSADKRTYGSPSCSPIIPWSFNSS